MGITGAGALIIASPNFGIFFASLIGNPTATVLIRRFRLAEPQKRGAGVRQAENFGMINTAIDEDARQNAIALTGGMEEDGRSSLSGFALLRNLLLILLVMGAGAIIGLGLTSLGVTMPAYVGAMVMAAVIRNADDQCGGFASTCVLSRRWARLRWRSFSSSL